MLFPRRKIHTGFGCEDRRQQRSDEEECTVHNSSERAGGRLEMELVIYLTLRSWSCCCPNESDLYTRVPAPTSTYLNFHISKRSYFWKSQSRDQTDASMILDRWSALEGEQRVMEEWISSRYLPRLLVQMGGPRCSAHTTCLSCYVICHS